MTKIEVFSEHLECIKDFRKPQGKRYQLHNLLTIMVLVMLSGCDDFEAMALFSRKKADFSRAHHLFDDKKVPSHDLFRWIMMSIDKFFFSHFLHAWLESMPPNFEDVDSPELSKNFIHIDGKVLRATRTAEHTPIYHLFKTSHLDV